MAYDVTDALTIAATALDGVLAGASLDQSIKQLPSRHALGPVAYSRYSQTSDLGPGITWYGTLGIGAALLTIAVAVSAIRQKLPRERALPLSIGAALTLLHSLATSQAAPINFSQRRVADDPAALAEVFDRFARWQALRCTLQVLTFAVMIWGLVAGARRSAPTPRTIGPYRVEREL